MKGAMMRIETNWNREVRTTKRSAFRTQHAPEQIQVAWSARHFWRAKVRHCAVSIHGAIQEQDVCGSSG